MRTRLGRWTRVAAFVACLVCAGPARGDEFYDFRIPAHRAYGWTASLTGDLGRSSSGEPTRFNRNHLAGGNLGTQAYWFHDSDPRLTSFSFQGSAGATESNQDVEASMIGAGLQTITSHDRDRQAAENWIVSLTHRAYPWPAPIGGTVSLGGGGVYNQSWSSTNQDFFNSDAFGSTRSVTQEHREAWRYATFAFASVGVGVGRVRDATGVQDVLLLEERLRRSGTLTRPLSIESRMRLAELMGVLAGSYAGVRDRPARHVWREIERILREDGALSGDGLAAEDVLRALEPYFGSGSFPGGSLVPNSPILRWTGAFLGPVVVGNHTRILFRDDLHAFQQTTVDGVPSPPTIATVGSRIDVDDSELLGGIGTEYHRPVGPHWQFDLATRVLFPFDDLEHGLETSSSIAGYWIVSERWLAGASVAHAHSIREAREPIRRERSDWAVRYQAELIFYLEDRTQLHLAVAEQQFKDHVGFSSFPPAPSAPRFNRNGRVTLALTYRLLGGFDAGERFPSLALR